MPSKKKRFNARFPPARIKKIMQKDEEVGKVAQAVPLLIEAKALESFAEHLLTSSSEVTRNRNARTLTPNHIKSAIFNEAEFQFLRELAQSIPDVNNPVDEDNPNVSQQNDSTSNNTKNEDNNDMGSSLMTHNNNNNIFLPPTSSTSTTLSNRGRKSSNLIVQHPSTIFKSQHQIVNNHNNAPRSRGRPRKRPIINDEPEPSSSSMLQPPKKKLNGKMISTQRQRELQRRRRRKNLNSDDDDEDSEAPDDNDNDEETTDEDKTEEDEEGNDDDDYDNDADEVDDDDYDDDDYDEDDEDNDNDEEEEEEEEPKSGENVSKKHPYDLTKCKKNRITSTTLTDNSTKTFNFAPTTEPILNDEDDYDNC